MTVPSSIPVRPLKKEVCDRVRPGLYEILTQVGVTSTVDVDQFMKLRGFQPCINTVFLVSSGTYYVEIPGIGMVETYNGCITTIGKEPYFDLSRRYQEELDK
jgi:hypothetical protein